jgi:hypothetical protein
MALRLELLGASAIKDAIATGNEILCQPDNDTTVREEIWRRFEGSDWAAYDALPPAVRRRIHQHAYDAWSVNALILWRHFRRKTACSQRAERRLLRYLDECETLEREAFAEAYRRERGLPLPHVAARATVMRGR